MAIDVGSPLETSSPAGTVPSSDGSKVKTEPASTSPLPRPVESSEQVPKSAEPTAEVVPDDERLGTTRLDRLVLGLLVTVCLVVAGWRWAKLSGWGAEPIEIDRQTPLFHAERLNPNTATWVELMQLEGIGEVLARRIVEDREASGPFTSVDDLQRVSGIGAKTVEKLRPWMEIRSTSEND